MNGFKDSLFVGAVPAEPSVADDMVGRYETEMAGIYRLVGIIGQYPIVVLLEKGGVQRVSPVFPWDDQHVFLHLFPDKMTVYGVGQFLPQLIFLESREAEHTAEILLSEIPEWDI